MTSLKKTTLCISGMHCPSCDILVKNKFKEVSNIKEIRPNHKKQTAEVFYIGKLDTDLLNQKISQFGYKIVQPGTRLNRESYKQRLIDAGSIAVIIFVLYFFAQQFNLLPSFTLTNGSTLTYATVFFLGLVASTSTCMATSGALFMATIGKAQDKGTKTLLPAVSFNLGRILSYGLFGFIAGFIGKTLTANLQLGTVLNIFVSVFMVLIGLNMLKLISFSAANRYTNGIFEKLEQRFIKSPRKTAFLLGAITYLLPCGFTQSVQLYSLGLANPVQSALLMMVFAVGTTPMLMAIGFASSFTKTSWYTGFAKVVGVLIVLIGISYFANFLSIYGLLPNVTAFSNEKNFGVTADIKSGVQEIKMNVNSFGYKPSSFTVKQGVPVRWIINGENVYGCQASLVSPQLGINTVLNPGENVVEFTPEQKGSVLFSCSMGMYRGVFNII